MKLYTSFITSLLVSAALALNYIYFLYNRPNYGEFFISLYGYSLYVFTLFIIGAGVSFILDFKIKRNIYNFVSYIFIGGLVGTLFCFIGFRGISIKFIFQMMILGIICAILFWLIQEVFKRTCLK